jgi:hypothetical protein
MGKITLSSTSPEKEFIVYNIYDVIMKQKKNAKKTLHYSLFKAARPGPPATVVISMSLRSAHTWLTPTGTCGSMVSC